MELGVLFFGKNSATPLPGGDWDLQGDAYKFVVIPTYGVILGHPTW